MNTATIKGNWNIAKGKLKQKYSNLTDDDLRYEEGKEQELFGRLQKRTGQSREALETFLRKECDCDFSPSSSSKPWETSPQPAAEQRNPNAPRSSQGAPRSQSPNPRASDNNPPSSE